MSPTINVVFVCEHGAAKSMIAATTFNRLATARGLAAHAISRGTVPDSAIPPLVRDGLRADGVDVGNITPKGLGHADQTGANLFITFDVDLPPSIAPPVAVRRWDEMPSVLESFDVARDAINARVATLVTELERAPS